jgi:SNF2 family DNA or RNA helicase
MIQINRGKYTEWKPRPGAVETVAAMIGDKVVRYTLDQCVDLPDTYYTTRKVEPTAQQAKLYKELISDGLSLIDADGAIRGMNEAVVMTKCLQVAMGAVKFTKLSTSEDEIADVDCKPKLEALESLVNESEGPVIVFCPYLAPLSYIEQWAKDNKYDYVRVDGGTSQTGRADAFKAVQEGRVKLLLANPSAMAHGVTLTASNQIVWWGLPYSRETYEQANGRIIRKGQERVTHITHLTCLPVEDKVFEALRRKGELQGLLMKLLDNKNK